MVTRSLSFDQALQELASLLTRIQVAQLAPQAIADDWPERMRILELAQRFDPEYVQLAYQIAVHGRKELSLAPDEQAGFVMTLLRLYTFRPMTGKDVVADAPRAVKIAPVVPQQVSAPQPVRNAPPVGEASMLSIESEVEATEGGGEAPVSEMSPITMPVSEPVVEPHGEIGAQSADWHVILDALKLGGMARELAQHCQLRQIEQNRIVLCLSPTHRHLQMKPAQDKLQQVLSEYFGRPLQLAIELEMVAGDTPAATAQRRRQEQQDRAIASVEQDSFVREVIDVFDATLIESSIKPV
jgi:DNA polymerase-3 subunit gamma/tau